MTKPKLHALALLLIATAPVHAQSPALRFDVPHSSNPFNAYRATLVPQANLANSPRIDALIQDGVLELSLSDAIALALENNLDLAIARYNIPIAQADVLRTRAGGVFRGVNTGVVQNTPGGGIGGFWFFGHWCGARAARPAAAGGAGHGSLGPWCSPPSAPAPTSPPTTLPSPPTSASSTTPSRSQTSPSTAHPCCEPTPSPVASVIRRPSPPAPASPSR